MNRLALCSILPAAVLCCALSALAQQQSETSVIVPRLIRFSGFLKDSGGKPLQGTAGVTFGLYKNQDGGAALWLETQNVSLDSSGHYIVLLGATKEEGVPMELFTSGQAQWLGIHVQGQPEQPRVWMVSVPYALKAADAETLGGMPASAFALASNGNAARSVASTVPATSTASTTALIGATPTGSGTTNFLPLWTSSSNVANSVAAQLNGNVGIGFTAPLPASFASKLDVNGGAFIRGLLQLPPTSSATASAGKNSNALDLVGSSFLNTLAQPANQRFRWQVEPVGNNTSSPSGKLNLLYGLGSNTPSETGLSISKAGAMTVPGVTLPSVGTASGTNLAGFNSRPLDLLASAWNTSGTPTAVTEHFRWQAEPAGSNTMAPSGKLSLLFASGSSSPAETGLSISNKGLIKFATGQTFPGTGPGTVNSVGLTAPSSDFMVSGSPVTGSGILALNWTVPPTADNVANAIVKRDGSGSFSSQLVSANKIIAFGIPGSGNIGVEGALSGSDGVGVVGVVSIAGKGGQGVIGESHGTVISGNGLGPDGVDGFANSNVGSGVGATNTAGGDGIFASSATGFAGFFSGDVEVDGTLSKAGGAFKIDHPLDPANKYLYHSFVESPDMKNIYDGTVITNAEGIATVTLPDWFEALNHDFRYQLTVIGQFAQAIVASEIAKWQFTIKTDKPNVKVSWQVTGVRQDAWANAHRIPIEQVKPEKERGLYLHPEVFGAPIEKSITASRHPYILKLLEERERMQRTSAKAQSPK